jgi:hypothetical protein
VLSKKDATVSVAQVISVIHQMEADGVKDFARLLQFIEAAAIDAERFQRILQRHGLIDRWRTFERRFLQGES